jgi:hypothetical protein
MPITVRKKNPVTHSIKVAIATLMIFIVVGLVARITKRAEEKIPNSEKRQSNFLGNYLDGKSTLLIQRVRLHVPDKSEEHVWTSFFADLIGGNTEVEIDRGRADILTDNYAIEVDFLRKWKEGLGQALYYAKATNRIAVLALIEEGIVEDELLKTIESLCTEKGVKVVLLVSDLLNQ